MENMYDIIEAVADACYSDSRKIAREEIAKLVDAILNEKQSDNDLLLLLSLINEALEVNDFVTIADYMIYGLKPFLEKKAIPECIFYPYSEIIPDLNEDIFYLASFLDSEPVLCMKIADKTIRFNSLYSPINEAEYFSKHLKLKKSTPVVCVFGIGTGILVEKILERISVDSKLIIYEPDNRIMDYCKEAALGLECSEQEKRVYERITNIINDSRVYLFQENNSKTSFQVILESNVDYTGIAGLIHLINYGYADAYSNSCMLFYRELNDFRVRLLTNKNTELLFMDEYIDYSFRNIHLCKKINLASELTKIIPEDIPSIIVSAGPSLNKNIEELRKVKGHFFIVAVDTALQYLLKRDIIPDLWVTIDPIKPLSFFKDDRSYDIPCAFKSTANADILNRVNRVILLDGERDYMELLIDSLGTKLSKPYGSGGSVATTSFALLYSIGIKNIIMIGQDLAYQGEASHADGVSDGSDYDTTYVEGIDGHKVKTRSDWLNYLKWFEHSMEMINSSNSNISVIDATEGGAKIRGTKIMTLNEAIDYYRNDKGNLPVYDFANEIKKLKYVFDEQGYKSLCEKHRKEVNRIREIELDAYEAYKLCEKLIIELKEGYASDRYLHKQNKIITQIREKIESSPAFFIIDRYAQNFTFERKAQLELAEGDKNMTQINLVEILKLTFDSYVKASKKIYEIAKKYEKDL